MPPTLIGATGDTQKKAFCLFQVSMPSAIAQLQRRQQIEQQVCAVGRRRLQTRRFSRAYRKERCVYHPVLLLLWLWMWPLQRNGVGGASSSSSGGMILRIRRTNGSIGRILVPNGSQNSTALSDILSAAVGDSFDKVRVDGEDVDASKSISELGLQHGALVSVLSSLLTTQESPQEKGGVRGSIDTARFDPFPELAKSKSYKKALDSRRRHHRSYSDICKLQSAMHSIEPQSTGPIHRVYICSTAAQRFKDSCVTTSKNKETVYGTKAALLFGSIHTEPLDTNKPRSSLSNPRYEQQTCKVLKVHAIWEPPLDSLTHYNDHPYIQRAILMAQILDMSPIGWIYSYTTPQVPPVTSQQVKMGATIQIENMKKSGRDLGYAFVTCAMHALTGETEAFQISNVCIQMVAEDILTPQTDRLFQTTVPVLVDSKEVNELECLLCLVNTAMLQHIGLYSSSRSVLKKGGVLNAKGRKRLVSALNNNDKDFLQELVDFDVLMALDTVLNQALPMEGKELMKELGQQVKQHVRGQRADIKNKWKLLLQSVLGT